MSNKPFKGIENQRDDLWFGDLKRKRKSGPSQTNKTYSNYSMSTQSVHAGQYDDPLSGAIGTPIFQSSTFYLNSDRYESVEEGTARDTFIYTRYGNPSQWSVQEKIATLENAESAIVFSSGMAAISSSIFAMVEKGCNIITSRDLYGGTYNLLYEDLQRFGIEVKFVDMTDLEEIESAIDDRTKLMFFESLSNPLLKMAPVDKLVEIRKNHGLRIIIDNTFLTPFNLKPLDLGVDLVVNSATKYLGGHSDLVAGTVSGSRKMVDMVWGQMLKLGGSMDPHACFMLERSLKTFALRMRAHNYNATVLADFLQDHPRIKQVFFPGFDSYPYEADKERMGAGSSGMISFVLEGGDEMSHALLAALKLPREATSLGGVESLVSLPYNTSQASLTKKQRQAIGIQDGTVRLSVGIEDSEDLINDFKQALDTIYEK